MAGDQNNMWQAKTTANDISEISFSLLQYTTQHIRSISVTYMAAWHL